MDQKVKQQRFLKYFGFYTQPKSWDWVIYKARIQIRPKRSWSDQIRIRIRNTDFQCCRIRVGKMMRLRLLSLAYVVQNCEFYTFCCGSGSGTSERNYAALAPAPALDQQHYYFYYLDLLLNHFLKKYKKISWFHRKLRSEITLKYFAIMILYQNITW
jgi:hypothetical protein